MILPKDWFLSMATVMVSTFVIATEITDGNTYIPVEQVVEVQEEEVNIIDVVHDVLRARISDDAWRTRLAETILESAQRHNIEEYSMYLAGMVLVESGGNRYAVGPTVCLERDEEKECTLYGHAKGLAQIMDVYWKDYPSCKGNLFQTVNNLSCQAFVFKTMLNRCDERVLCAMNRYWGTTKYWNETSPYTDKVMEFVNTD